MASKPKEKIYEGQSPLEREEQVSFFNRVAMLLLEYPWLGAMYAIPNGGVRPAKTVYRNGRAVRVCASGKKMKKEGVKAGVPDIHLPAPRGQYHGLYIEAKRMPYRSLDGRIHRFYPSKEQKEFMAILKALGHKVVLCHGVDAMFQTLLEYIELPPFPGVDYEYFAKVAA